MRGVPIAPFHVTIARIQMVWETSAGADSVRSTRQMLQRRWPSVYGKVDKGGYKGSLPVSHHVQDALGYWRKHTDRFGSMPTYASTNTGPKHKKKYFSKKKTSSQLTKKELLHAIRGASTRVEYGATTSKNLANWFALLASIEKNPTKKMWALTLSAQFQTNYRTMEPAVADLQDFLKTA